MADLERLVEGATIDIADASARADAEMNVVKAPLLDAAAILRATGKASDGPVSKSLNRPVSRLMSRLLLRLPGFRPIHATIGTASIATVMFVALAAGGAPGMIAGGLLFHLASVFDGVDGEVARATFRTSAAGAALDSAIDAATNFLFILGVTLNLALGGIPHAAALGAWGLALLAIGMATIGRQAARADGTLSFDLLKQRFAPSRRGPTAFLVTFVTTVTSRDFFAFLFAVLIVAGRGLAVLYIFAGAATVWILIVAAAAVPLRHRRST